MQPVREGEFLSHGVIRWDIREARQARVCFAKKLSLHFRTPATWSQTTHAAATPSRDDQTGLDLIPFE